MTCNNITSLDKVHREVICSSRNQAPSSACNGVNDPAVSIAVQSHLITNLTDGCLEGLKLMHTLENIQQPSLLAVQSHSDSLMVALNVSN